MKPFRTFATAIAACMTLFLCSCGSGDDKTKESSQDTSQTKMSETPPEKSTEAPKPAGVLVAIHKVANFAKWKMSYDSHDSVRKANGLHNYVIARGLAKDSNTVMVVLKADDMIKAQEFGSSKELKDAMHDAGVVGTPTVNYSEIVWEDNSKIDQPNRLMVRHKVKNFNSWKTEFESHKQERMDAGLVDRVIAHTTGDSNDVGVVFAVNDMAKAKALIASKDLKDRMTKAGVEGTPTFFFYNIVQVY